MKSKKFQATGRLLSYELPHGQSVISSINFTWTYDKCALVGSNGVGKSTLAKILSGVLAPTSGEFQCVGSIIYLPQLETPPNQEVSEYLMDVWEVAFVDSPVFWSELLSDISMEKNLSQLSGGEWMRLRIAKALSRNADLIILDEPTNNLDRQGKDLILSFIDNYSGSLLVISHDREILNLVDGIWELSSQGLNSYGGNFDLYEQEKGRERSRLDQKIEKLKVEKNNLLLEVNKKLQAQEKRMRKGEKTVAKGGVPRIVAGNLKRQAQESYSKIVVRESLRTEVTGNELSHLISERKQESDFLLALEATKVPEGKLIFELEKFNLQYPKKNFEGADQVTKWLWSEDLTFTMRGPRRWAIAGGNGTGKTSLVKTILNLNDGVISKGSFKIGDVAWKYLDQNYSLLQGDETILNNIKSVSVRSLVELRNELAKFQFFGEMVYQKVSELSGGEKLKLSLAKLFLSDSMPQLLILDEPTNNLDLQGLYVLESALRQFRGALLVISHDRTFLQNIKIENILNLN